MKRRVVHVITGLGLGGAETMLYKLLFAIDREQFDLLVVSILDKGVMGPRLEALGIEVVPLQINKPFTFLSRLFYLWRRLRTTDKADVLQGWMYHGNLLCTALSWVLPKTKVFWNVRQCLTDFKNERPMTRKVIATGKLFSKYCDRIIYNSHTSLNQHSDYGYCKQVSLHIPNGFNVGLFDPDNFLAEKAQLRTQYSIPADSVVVGLIARYHPSKGQREYIEAMKKVIEKYPQVHVLAVGKNVPEQFQELIEGEHAHNFHLLGMSQNIPQLLSIVDIGVSSSLWGEAFSNSIGEAMAMALPCVVTDVGDSAMIIGGHGAVVPPGDVTALAEAVMQLVEVGPSEREKIGQLCRARVIDNFSLEKVTETYSQLYS